MMACNGGCGGSRAGKTIHTEVRERTDPTEGIFASMTQRYMVVRSSGDQNGKRFGTLVAAQDYARRTGGIIRPI